jgi:transcriptional regulator with XRE-family HTH domain
MMANSNLGKRPPQNLPASAQRMSKILGKHQIALQLRSLRKQSGLTQRDVEAISGLSQPAISRLEAARGALPQIETIERYVAACNGRIDIVISARDEAA